MSASRRLGPLSLLCWCLSAAGATGTTVIPPTFADLVAGARTIVVARVVGVRPIWDPTPQGTTIVTQVTLSVEEVWKGAAGPVTELEFLGGTIGDTTVEVSGMPAFAVGQRAVLFIGPSVNVVSPLVGLMYGRLKIERDAATGVDRVRSFDGRSLASTDQIGRAPRGASAAVPMRLIDLAAAVRARLNAGRTP